MRTHFSPPDVACKTYCLLTVLRSDCIVHAFLNSIRRKGRNCTEKCSNNSPTSSINLETWCGNVKHKIHQTETFEWRCIKSSLNHIFLKLLWDTNSLKRPNLDRKLHQIFLINLQVKVKSFESKLFSTTFKIYRATLNSILSVFSI